jgi:AraC family transcriptional regulator
MEMNKYQKEYIYRINKVIDYIERNLESELTLEKLASEANFSQFHFHRIFSAFMNETLTDFIKRKRINKAASMLITDTEKPVLDVAYACGFNSFSVFCRNFKDQFGVSAQEFRRQGGPQFSKNNQTQSNLGKSDLPFTDYVCNVESLKKWRIEMNKNIEILEMPAMDVIYCRFTGPFDQIGVAYDKLFKWAGPRGLLNFPETKGITFYHDDPKVMQPGKTTQSACITVKGNVKTEGEIGKMTIPSGKHVVGHFEIGPTEFQQAWDSVCLWLSESGYQPADASPYELYHNNHELHPEKKFIVDICIPVKVL